MGNFEFKSQVATSVEQSKRLLELGLKKETADCMYSVMTKSYNGRYILEEDRQYNLILFRQEEVQSVGFSHYEHIPAWSLYRLLEVGQVSNETWQMHLNAPRSYDVFDLMIECIEENINARCFNEDYLEEKK